MKSMIYIYNRKPCEIDKKEVLRYAKAGNDDATLNLLDECIRESSDVLSYKACYARFNVKAKGDELDLGFTRVRSHSLSLCLDGCYEIILFAATIGVQFDRLIARYGITAPAKAVLLQALGSERIEAFCDELCRDISKLEGAVGNAIRPRFSPGYGDLPLEIQREVFSALDCTKNIGISLSDSLFMTPTKSVTAIIGIYSK